MRYCGIIINKGLHIIYKSGTAPFLEPPYFRNNSLYIGKWDEIQFANTAAMESNIVEGALTGVYMLREDHPLFNIVCLHRADLSTPIKRQLESIITKACEDAPRIFDRII